MITRKPGHMWGWPLEFWDNVAFWTLVVGSVFAGIGVGLTAFSSLISLRTAAISQAQANQNIADARSRGEQAQADAAKANARAAEANQKAEEEKLARVKIEERLTMVMGVRWDPLVPSEISALADKLRAMPKSKAQIMYEGEYGKELAQSFLQAFQDAGWKLAFLSTGGGFQHQILAGWGSRGIAIKAAIESTTKLSVEAANPEAAANDELVILGVGIKPASQ
jgi:hypothetical protein